MLEEDGFVFISDVPDDPETFVPISRDELNKITMLGFDQAESEKYDQYYEYVSLSLYKLEMWILNKLLTG